MERSDAKRPDLLGPGVASQSAHTVVRETTVYKCAISIITNGTGKPVSAAFHPLSIRSHTIEEKAQNAICVFLLCFLVRRHLNTPAA
jgi:hypothetical protein